MLRKELDLGYPMIYDGQSSSGGHAFVCDGYSEDGTFHINWGWDGYSNGYFVLSTLDAEGDGNGYSDGQAVLLEIRPEQSGEEYFIRPYLIRANYSKSGNNASVSFDMKYYALKDHVFYLEYASSLMYWGASSRTISLHNVLRGLAK